MFIHIKVQNCHTENLSETKQGQLRKRNLIQNYSFCFIFLKIQEQMHEIIKEKLKEHKTLILWELIVVIHIYYRARALHSV